MADQRTYKIIGAALEVQSADYADPPATASPARYRKASAEADGHKRAGCPSTICWSYPGEIRFASHWHEFHKAGGAGTDLGTLATNVMNGTRIN